MNLSNKLFLAIVSVVLNIGFAKAIDKPVQSTQKPSRANISKPPYQPVSLGDIKPKGWLLEQLTVMKNGATGQMDKIYDKIKNDNGWLGGKGDNWEETPYWLDGAVPLAYQLNDTALKAIVLRYINWSIDNQRPSGYFGPITKWERKTGKQLDLANCEQGEDWWPKMIMLKVIQQYYSATQDKRVIPFMTKYFNYQKEALKKCPIGKWSEWAQSRGTDNVMMAQWLYGITKDGSLLELAGLINAQSFAWSQWFGGRDWVINAAARPNGKKWMSRHGVNVAMGLKDPAINFQRTGDSTYLKTLKTVFNDLMTLHGLPHGIFSADEDLHGNQPTQGTELCATVEAMYSLEEIINITGDIHYIDALERMTFNAMPSQTTDDYHEKQYFQIANQIEISRGVFAFTLPFDRKMNCVLGAKSGYTCCYVNMHQGWTKFSQNLWHKTENGLAALIYGPNRLSTKVGSQQTDITIEEATNYPFDDQINFNLSLKKAVTFPFQLRIPAWCKEAVILINGKTYSKEKGGKIITINRTWKNKDQLTLQLPMEVAVSEWADNSRAVERGPLVYGLKVQEKWTEGTDEKEGKYFEVHPASTWNYGLLEAVSKNPVKETTITFKALKKDFRWNLENSPLEIIVKAKKIPGWKSQNGLAYLPVTGREGFYKGPVDSNIENVALVPVGFTKLRIIAFPVVK